jgi:wyosine [tRNA(Phe)-imidazoG37] synthetase (radical SAM superfamily)
VITFGPVPSRRLGQSLGINNIPPKTCTYACVYCQVGRTTRLQIRRQAFYPPQDIVRAVQRRVEEARRAGEVIDVLTFVPDGEATLDANLGREIRQLRELGLPLAVITNASLITHPDVHDALLLADWVSLKVDAVDEAAWKAVNRPHGRLDLPALLDSCLRFAAVSPGRLLTETMLVAGVNDDEARVAALAGWLAQLAPSTAYLAVPTRPPAEAWVRAPAPGALHRAYRMVRDQVPHVETLAGYEGDAFAATGELEADLLSITAVHPMREEALRALVHRAQAPWTVVDRLVAEGRLVETTYAGHRFYRRQLGKGT